MLYWLIPYLVAYRGSSSGDWKYGPEHVFKAEVRSSILVPEAAVVGYSEIDMDFTCRPINSSVLRCRTESGTLDKYEVKTGSTSREKFAHSEDFGMVDIIFQVKFDEVGISRVWFLNERSSHRSNMIMAIIGTLNTGIRLAGKKFENYVSPEKSVIGTCTTNFSIKKKFLSEEEAKRQAIIEGYTFDLPTLGFRTDDATIVISKDRNVSDCTVKTPYFFGDFEDDDAGHENLVTYSKSEIHLGEESFSAYTESLGTIVQELPKKSAKVEMSTREMIRVSLRSIRPAEEKLWNSENGVKVGAGFEPGTPWPDRKTQRKKNE